MPGTTIAEDRVTTQPQDRPSSHPNRDTLINAAEQLDRIAVKLEDSTADFEVCLSRLRADAAAAGAQVLGMAENGTLSTDLSTPWRYYSLQNRELDMRSNAAELPRIPAHEQAPCYFSWNQLSGKTARGLRDQVRQIVARHPAERRPTLVDRLKGIVDCISDAGRRRRSTIAFEDAPDHWHHHWSWLHDLIVGTIRSGDFQALDQDHPTWTYLEQYAGQSFFRSFGHPSISSGRSSPPLTFEALVTNLAYLHEQAPFVDPGAYCDRHVLIEHCLGPRGSSNALRMAPWGVELASFDLAIHKGEQAQWCCDHGLTPITAAALAVQLAAGCRTLADDVPTQDSPALNHKAIAVLHILMDLAAAEALKTSDILDKAAKVGMEELEKSDLTGRIMPALRKHYGVESTPVGYRIRPNQRDRVRRLLSRDGDGVAVV